MKKIIKLIIIIIVLLLLINGYIFITTNYKIVNIDNISSDEYDCILVLGAGIRSGNPSPMLEDRLLTATELYDKGVAHKILVSGDHENSDYDEVNVMKKYLIERGIPSENVFMDHAGLSTYDSVYRAKKIFKVNRAIIVTQKYHLHRALYIANKLDLEVYGVSATKKTYFGQGKRNVREFLARIKDFFKCLVSPEPTYLGEVISIKGNGDKTNDDVS